MNQDDYIEIHNKIKQNFYETKAIFNFAKYQMSIIDDTLQKVYKICK